MKNKLLSSLFSILQRVGQSLMVPVSVLPAAGLLIAFGRLFPETTLLHQLFVKGGLSVFEQLSVLFSIGVAIGFTGGAGIAGLAAAVGYFLLKSLLKVTGDFLQLPQAIDTGVFGGIIVGLIASWVYGRFLNVKLPAVLGFFAGKRLIPILTALFTIGLSVILTFIWPPIQDAIRQFGYWVSVSQFGPAFYAAGKRLLIPMGLHHVYYPSFLYEFGEYTKAAGEIVRGDSARYYAGDPTAGKFMASEFPIMLFGLPAAALAMTLRAYQENRKIIAGIMMSAALTSIITGITEPIEFSFIFVAPLLFVLHVLYAFLSGFLTQIFDIHLGYTFSASLIDFATGYFNQKNSFYLWLVVGPLIGILYFFSFYYLIGLFNFKTPGRDTAVDPAIQNRNSSLHDLEHSAAILSALGGAENIKSIDACITRLRLELENPSKLQESKLNSLGASGVLKAGSNIQVVFGTQSDHIKEKIKILIKDNSLLKISNFVSPMSGNILSLEQVPDKTFSQKILGDGFAVDPVEGIVISPFNGTVVSMIGSNHAVGLVSDEGLEILIHVGIDTVKLKGQGFRAFVKENDRIIKGQDLIHFDLSFVKANCPSTISPVIFTNSDGWKWNLLVSKNDTVRRGQNLVNIEKKGS